MKTSIITLLIILSATNFSLASRDDKESTKASSTKVELSVRKERAKYDLNYKSNITGKVIVVIYNRSTEIFREVFPSENCFMRTYNFENLPAGEYTIEVTNKAGKVQKNIVHVGLIR